MAKRSSYKCNKCEEKFEAIIGDLRSGKELRCVDCDTSEYVDGELKEKVCEKCGGNMRHIGSPMCPACKSRDNTVENILMWLD